MCGVGGVYDDMIWLILIIAAVIAANIFVYERGGGNRRTRETVILAAMCAVTVAGRLAFFAFPGVKPLCAFTILFGMFWKDNPRRFMLGAVSGLVSDFFFGTGVWTLFRMFALGLLACVSGAVFSVLPRNRAAVSVYGFIATLVLYGGIMDLSTVIFMRVPPDLQSVAAVYAAGLPSSLVNAGATAVFLFIMCNAVLRKTDRIRTKL